MHDQQLADALQLALGWHERIDTQIHPVEMLVNWAADLNPSAAIIKFQDAALSNTIIIDYTHADPIERTVLAGGKPVRSQRQRVAVCHALDPYICSRRPTKAV